MKSTQSKERATGTVVKLEKNLSMMERRDETQRLGLQVLSELSGEETSDPATSLVGHSQRLMNVAHSFIEERETAYLESKTSDLATSPSDFSIDAVCKLTEQSLQCMKLAMEVRSAKVRNFSEIMKALK